MKGFMLFVCVVLIGFGIYIGFFAPTFYSGKETFYSEQEYTMFKEVISSPEIQIKEMQSLSSSPPIIVQFELVAPRDVAFPYGKGDSDIRPIVGCVLSVLGLAFLCYVLFYKPEPN